jgi:PilZ domain
LPEDEHRYAIRLRKYIDVVIEDLLSSMLVRGGIADLSPRGMRVIADQYLAPGARYTFTMKCDPFLRLRGEVRWIRRFTADTFQAGVLIVDAAEEDCKRLNTFLEGERRRLTGG